MAYDTIVAVDENNLFPEPVLSSLKNNFNGYSKRFTSGNLDDLRTPGRYHIPSQTMAQNILGFPKQISPRVCWIDVVDNGSGYCVQIMRVGGEVPRVLMRSSLGPDREWLNWAESKFVSEGENPYTPLTSSADLNTLRTPGSYRLTQGVAALVANYPSMISPAKVTWIDVYDNGAGYIIQRLLIGDRPPRELVRLIPGPTAEPEQWYDINSTVSEDNSVSETTYETKDVAFRNKILVDDFSRRYGNSTGGTGAVAFRFDHGLNNFKDTILPLIRDKNIKVSIALNSKNWSKEENNLVPSSEVDDWVKEGRVEIWNHSATHLEASTSERLKAEIVDSLVELRSQVPSASIDGWNPPGVTTSGVPYMGAGTFTSPQSISASIAGKLILSNHAVMSGHFPNSFYRPLDGVIRNAEIHVTLDNTTTFESFQTYVDKAIADKKGIQFMTHPSVINTPGKVTTDLYRRFFDYVVQKQSEGVIKVLSPYQLIAARTF